VKYPAIGSTSHMLNYKFNYKPTANATLLGWPTAAYSLSVHGLTLTTSLQLDI